MKKTFVITLVRIACVAVLSLVLYRNYELDVALTSIAVWCLAIWAVPNMVYAFLKGIFKWRTYDGTLQCDESDPNDCKFRFVLDKDVEELSKQDELLFLVEKCPIGEISHVQKGEDNGN